MDKLADDQKLTDRRKPNLAPVVAMVSLAILHIIWSLHIHPLALDYKFPLDVIVLLVTIVCLLRIGFNRLAKFLTGFGAILLSFLWFYKVSDDLFFIFYGRSILFRYDLWFIPNLWDLAIHMYSLPETLLALMGFCAVIILLVYLFFTLIRQSTRLIASDENLIVYGMVAFFFMTCSCIRIANPNIRWQNLVDDSATVRFYHQVNDFKQYIATRDDEDRTILARSLELMRNPLDLKKILGMDVFVFYVESYGRALWEDSQNRTYMASFYQKWAQRIKNNGYYSVSAFMESPAKGGGSWIADTTFISGIFINSFQKYDSVLKSNHTPLSGLFKRHGYHTVSVMPAMKFNQKEISEGIEQKVLNKRKFYQFDQDYWFKDFNYHGPSYGWSLIPDQYTLAFIKEKVLKTTSQPLYLDIVLTSSHAPFCAIPPFVGNMDLMQLQKMYQTRAALTFDNSIPKLNQPRKGYTTGIKYSLSSVFDFVLYAVKNPALIIILGDHQPYMLVPGTTTNDIPIHILSKNRSVIDSFLGHGFKKGLDLDSNQRSWRMDQFYVRFLKSVSGRIAPDDHLASIKGG